MPRPVSWLPRLHTIRRTVTASVRSHYDRHELEVLFELQPRAAQKLIEMLRSVKIGTSRIIEREVLITFLDRVQAADDTESLFSAIRAEKSAASRRKIRSLVRRDLEPVSLASLPSSIRLRPGQLEVSFTTIEQLAESLLLIARILENDGDQCAESFEVGTNMAHVDETRAEVDRMFANLEAIEGGGRASEARAR